MLYTRSSNQPHCLPSFREPRLHATNSRIKATTRGTDIDANSGVYTAYLCSAGKYSNASIPGLKKARDATDSALLDHRRAIAGEAAAVRYACIVEHSVH
jgi:hypothetical protein